VAKDNPSIDDIRNAVSPTPNESDERVEQERDSWENRQRQASLDDFRQNTQLRKVLAWVLLGFLGGWLLVVLIFLFLSGFGLWGFSLADSVLIALIAGATVNVIGLFGIVVRGLFSLPNGRFGSSSGP